MNILIVDDSPVMRKMIKKTIEMSNIDNCVFFEAGNGKEGLDILEKNWIDLILADINMPIMNGIEMIDEIKKNTVYNDIPILVISTEKSYDTMEYLKGKIVGFIHKPFTPEFFSSKISEITGGIYGKR
ncbi:MAG: response regulator [Elusimicrobiales bacterium]|nr:response regulator [Elusimicrobiales bacterium]